MGEIKGRPKSFENKSADPEFHNKFLEVSSALSREDAKLEQLQELVVHLERLRVIDAQLEEYARLGLGIQDDEYDLLQEERSVLHRALSGVAIHYDGRPLPPLTELSPGQLDILIQANRKGREKMLQAAISVFTLVAGNNPDKTNMRH